MLAIPRKYILDESNNPVAVQLDIAEFEKLESLIEDHGLAQIMEDEEKGEGLKIDDAKSFYAELAKKA